jgi:ABC-type transporter Mla maintaining outer membrane lipid asymmetry ATPase subunit MlaF
MAEVELHDVTVRRGGVTLLDHVDLSIAHGELVGVVGA